MKVKVIQPQRLATLQEMMSHYSGIPTQRERPIA